MVGGLVRAILRQAQDDKVAKGIFRMMVKKILILGSKSPGSAYYPALGNATPAAARSFMIFSCRAILAVKKLAGCTHTLMMYLIESISKLLMPTFEAGVFYKLGVVFIAVSITPFTFSTSLA
jgi:hypothetical protein